jgi:hypothetical protein
MDAGEKMNGDCTLLPSHRHSREGGNTSPMRICSASLIAVIGQSIRNATMLRWTNPATSTSWQASPTGLYSEILEAIKREKQIKKWNRDWKVNLIQEVNPGWRDLYDEIAT